MGIQWFPGHMAKARRQIKESLALIDIVIELTDARVPQSARNPDIPEIHSKPYILAVTKCDLADPDKTRVWADYWRTKNERAVLLELSKGRGIEYLRSEIKRSLPQIRRTPRALVVGIPNVGKSTLINRLAGKKSAKVGARPGVTRGKQWINAHGIQLLDTPGILWPKFTDQETAIKLAAVAAIRDEVFNWEEIALWLISYLAHEYPSLLAKRYDLVAIDQEPVVILDHIGRKRGCLRTKNEVDYQQAAQILLTDFRQGLIGPITLELPMKE